MIKPKSIVEYNHRSLGEVVEMPSHMVECDGYQLVQSLNGTGQVWFVRVRQLVEAGRRASVEVYNVYTTTRLVDGRMSVVGIPGERLVGTGRVWASQLV